MKRKTTLITTFVVIALFIILSGTGCSIGKNITTTDLSDIKLDGISIREDISTVDLSKYAESDKYSGDYKYKFDNLVINTDNDEVIYLFAPFDSDIKITVNGKDAINIINDVIDILGNNYESSVYDREQHLSCYSYFDHVNKTRADFVYSDFDDTLVFIYLSRNNSL